MKRLRASGRGGEWPWPDLLSATSWMRQRKQPSSLKKRHPGLQLGARSVATSDDNLATDFKAF